MRDVYVIAAARTAIGSLGGTLAEIGPARLAAPLISACLAHTSLVPEEVDEVILGCALQSGHGQNVARQAAREAAIPVERTAMVVNMVCGFGLRSVVEAARADPVGRGGAGRGRRH